MSVYGCDEEYDRKNEGMRLIPKILGWVVSISRSVCLRHACI